LPEPKEGHLVDSTRFDTVTRTLSSRRTALGGMVGGLAGRLGLVLPDMAAAHNSLPACIKRKTAKQRAACRRQARTHNKNQHSCKAQPLTTTCAGRCGVWKNNCDQASACFTCPPGRSCSVNGSCAQTCNPDTGAPCSATCQGCGFANTEGVNACIARIGPCPTQACGSTADCPVGSHCQPCASGGPNFCFQLCTT
jgi:hypothetical protein